MESKKYQQIDDKSRVDKERNINDGKENVPTKVAKPLVCCSLTTPKRPATYLKKKTCTF